MDSVVKLGIVGFGRIVELVHLPLLKHVEGIAVHGVYDVTPQRLALASRRGYRTFDDLERLLSAPLDAVLIATPPSSHYSLAELALRHGKHVMLEKPVALTGREALRLQDTARRCGKIVTVFHNRRYDPDYSLVKRMVEEEDELGPLLFVERRYHKFGSGASFGVPSFHPSWRNEAEYGGGALLDWGVHLADQLLGLRLGSCVKVNGRMDNLRWRQGEVEDYVHASLTLDNGILLSMEINFGSHASTPLWVVGGEKATLLVVSEKEAYLLSAGKASRAVALDPTIRNNSRPIYTSFADGLLTGGALEVTLDEAVQTMLLLDAVRESATSGKEVDYGHFVRCAAN